MLTAVLASVLFTAQVRSTVTLEPVAACQTCDTLTARVASLEAQIAARTVIVEPVRRVRLVQVSDPTPSVACYSAQAVPPVVYSAPTVTYSTPPGSTLATLSTRSPSSYSIPSTSYSSTYVERRGLFGGGLFGRRFSSTSVSACGPGGCP